MDFHCAKCKNVNCINSGKNIWLVNVPQEDCGHGHRYWESNADHIRAMSDEELAKNNIQAKYICSTDANGNWEVQYKTSDDTLFWDEDSAIEYELNWLCQPYKEKEDGSAT